MLNYSYDELANAYRAVEGFHSFYDSNLINDILTSQEYADALQLAITSLGIKYGSGSYQMTFQTSDPTYPSIQPVIISNLGLVTSLIDKKVLLKKKQKAYPDGVYLELSEIKKQCSIATIHITGCCDDYIANAKLAKIKDMINNNENKDLIYDVVEFSRMQIESRIDYINRFFIGDDMLIDHFGSNFGDDLIHVYSKVSNDGSFYVGTLNWKTKHIKVDYVQ